MTEPVRVAWTPKTVSGWRFADEWMNEWSLVLDAKLDPAQLTAYWHWCQREVTGVVEDIRGVAGESNPEMIIRLDDPPLPNVTHVAYNMDTVLGEDPIDTRDNLDITELPHRALREAWETFERQQKEET